MVLGARLRWLMSSIMRRRNGVITGSFASEWGTRRKRTPLMMPHRSGEEANGVHEADAGADRRKRQGEWNVGVAIYAVNPGCNAFLICFAIKICFFVARKALGGPGGTSCFFRG